MPSYSQYIRQRVGFDSNWHEEDHPRYEEGKFTDGNNKGIKTQQSSTLRVIVKPVADIKTYRKQTLQWYKDNLKGTTVTNPNLGAITFTQRGGNHILQNSGPEKLALTRILPELIQNGISDGWEELKKTRTDGWASFAFVYNNVIINGKEKRVGVYIAKDRNGKIFYDIVVPKEKGLVSNPQAIKGRDKAFTTDSIATENLIVNIFIEDAK